MRKRTFLPLTRKRAAALAILKAGALPLGQFAERMWGRRTAPKFAAHFLKDLVKRGLVERVEADDAAPCRITDEGARLLEDAPWACAYCGTESWDTGAVLALQPCRNCPSEHRSCRKCARRLLVVDGSFPRYRPAFKGCPAKRKEQTARA